MSERIALITGASSGIGLELAIQFAKHGSGVGLLARSTERLEHLSRKLSDEFKVRAEILAADLTRGEAPEEIAAELRNRGLTVDVLVNNAGFGRLGAYAASDLRRDLDMIQTNITALAHLTRIFLPEMIQRNSGGILNVASTAAFQAGPNMALYYASKAFVLSFTEALHEEVSGTGVRVTCLCPGPTDTGFEKANEMVGVKLFRVGVQSAAEVARVGYSAFCSNQAIAIPGIKNRALAFVAQVGARSVSRKVTKALNKI
jgi:short-subunit dehydrogenase